MAENPLPNVGNWYQEVSERLVFEVVAYDEDEQSIEVQYIDGELGEFDLDTWAQLQLEEIDEPEDWRHAYELSKEDYDELDDKLCPQELSDALNGIEPDDIGDLASE